MNPNREILGGQKEASFQFEAQTKVLRSEDLFGEDKTIYIRHGESLYRLMRTRSGKLILNK